MKIEKLKLEETEYFPPVFLDYINRNEKLKDFYGQYPEPDNFLKQVQLRQLSSEKRLLLQKVINQQYTGLEKSAVFTENLKNLIQPNTFTVTTGHQLNIFSGPLYFIYKLITTINLAKKLNELYADYHFIPLYWMASEDHDFTEINHFRLFNKEYFWETHQSGAVGRFDPHSLEKILKELPEQLPEFERAYLLQSTLANATRYYVNEFFGKEGLVVLDADHPSLKALFKEHMKEDILEQHSNRLVEETSRSLDDLGYKTQVFSRKINFFFLENSHRNRITYEDGKFEILNRNINYNKTAFLNILNEQPEKISPNVITRPLYQEVILPNIAYVGGPSEVAYWLQLKSVFEHYQVPFPIIMPRNFALIVNKTSARKLEKINIQVKDLFLNKYQLKDKYIHENGDHDYQLDKEKELMAGAFESIKSHARLIDKSLEGFIGSEESKVNKMLVNIEKRLKKAEEKKQETSIRQIEKLKGKLFPDGNLQERTDNILNFYLNNPNILDFLADHFDPFDFRFYIFIDDEEG